MIAFVPLYGAGESIAISIAISIIISAASYGLSVLLAPAPPPVTGARKSDLGAPTAAAGIPIPFAVGRNIVQAQIIWSTDQKETKHTKKVKGGKGGGKKQKITTFTYSISIALAFNDGEICGVQRIIANGSKVIWSASLGNPPTDAEIDEQVQAKYDEVYAAETTRLEALTNDDGTQRFTAAEIDDLADTKATNESEKLRKQLEAKQADANPRYAQIEIFHGTETQEPSSIIEAVEGVGNVPAFKSTAYIVIEDLELADFGNAMPIITVDYATLGTANTQTIELNVLDVTVVPGDQVLGSDPGSGVWTVNRGTVTTGTVRAGVASAGEPALLMEGIDDDGDLTADEHARIGMYVDLLDHGLAQNYEYWSYNEFSIWGTDNAGTGEDGQLRIRRWTALPAGTGGAKISAAQQAETFMPPDAAADSLTEILDTGVRFTEGGGTNTSATGEGRYLSVVFTSAEPIDGNEGHTDLEFLRTFIEGPTCIDSPVTLGDVIRAFTDRSGYVSAERSITSGLDSETIWGFNDNSGRTSREILEDLARVRPVMAHESEGLLKFRLADTTSQVTIPAGDVRAYDGRSNPPEWLAEVTILEDLSLPKSLQINYLDIDRALNATSSLFVREVTQATSRQELTVQAVDTAEDMRNSVITAFAVIMTSKRTFKLSLPGKYGVLEPGDRITVPVSDTRNSDVLIGKIEWGANLIVEIECALYIDRSLGIKHTDQFTAVSTDTASGAATSRLFLLDLPYLTDEAELNAADEEDDGIYVAVGAYESGWPGASVFVDQRTLETENAFGTITQVGGDPDWEIVLNFSAPSVWGRVGKAPRGDVDALVKDTVSEMIVSFVDVADDFFTSVSADAGVTSQDNVFLVGDEIVQAETVELLSDNLFAFRNLWRGLQGTEWAIGTQATGDLVVHLDFGAVQRFDTENEDLIGFGIDFRVVTVGEELTQIPTTSLTYDAVSRKPYAPGIHSAVRDGDGNLTFELEPRNRYGAEWTPDDPAFESDPQTFEVDIIPVGGGSPNPLRTIAVSDDTTISYSAAEQTADGLTPGDLVTVNAYQINASGRRGFAREETI